MNGLQIGQTIYGDSLVDGAGRVSINYDGSIVAIGALYMTMDLVRSPHHLIEVQSKYLNMTDHLGVQRGQEIVWKYSR